MRPEEFLKLMRRTPFVPLRVHMSDGSTYDIKHPEFAAVGRTSLIICVDERDGLPEDWVYCFWLHVTHVADLAQAAAPSAQ